MKVKSVDIENGIITCSYYGKTKSIKSFFESDECGSQCKSTSKHKVKGWDFKYVYLTHGDMENGAGWGFYA